MSASRESNRFPLIDGHGLRSEHVANFFIKKAAEDRQDIDLIKLVKLCYFGYGWALSILEKRLIDEDIQAWKWGPVIPSIYHSFKHHGREPITEFTPSIEMSSEEGIQQQKYFSIDEETDEGRILSIVWGIYRNRTFSELVDMTHKKGTPWYKVYKPHSRGMPIPDEEIKKHFDKIIDNKLKQVSETNR